MIELMMKDKETKVAFIIPGIEPITEIFVHDKKCDLVIFGEIAEWLKVALFQLWNINPDKPVKITVEGLYADIFNKIMEEIDFQEKKISQGGLSVPKA